MLGPDRSHSVTPCIPQTPQPKMVKKQRINYKASLNLNTQKLQVSLTLPLSILFLTTLSSSLPSPQLKIPFPRKGVPPNRNGDYSFRWLKNSEEGTIIYFCPVSPTLIRRLGSQDKSLGWEIYILRDFWKSDFCSVWFWVWVCGGELQLHQSRGSAGRSLVHGGWKWLLPKGEIIYDFFLLKDLSLKGPSIHPALLRALEHLRKVNGI